MTTRVQLQSRKDEIIGMIRNGYWPDWEAAPRKNEVLGDIDHLYRMEPDSLEYFQRKAIVLEYMAMNCIEQLSRGKYPQGMITRKILESIMGDAIRREQR